jgi:hypothetical protein
MSVFDALGLVLTVFGAILVFRKTTEELDEHQGSHGVYPYRLSGPSDSDIQRFSGGDDQGVSDEIY